MASGGYDFRGALRRPRWELAECTRLAGAWPLDVRGTSRTGSRLPPQQHRQALVRRRIKFVVEKGAMARLFRGGTHGALQEQLFRCILPEELAQIRTRGEYDAWLIRTVELDCWRKFSRNGLE